MVVTPKPQNKMYKLFWIFSLMFMTALADQVLFRAILMYDHYWAVIPFCLACFSEYVETKSAIHLILPIMVIWTRFSQYHNLYATFCVYSMILSMTVFSFESIFALCADLWAHAFSFKYGFWAGVMSWIFLYTLKIFTTIIIKKVQVYLNSFKVKRQIKDIRKENNFNLKPERKRYQKTPRW